MNHLRRIEFIFDRPKIDGDDFQRVVDEEYTRFFGESAREHLRKMPGGPFEIVRQQFDVSESRITVTLDFQPTDPQTTENVNP